ATLNSKVGAPLALYEAYDDMVAYLAKYQTGITIEQLAASIASPDAKGIYDGPVLKRLLPTPTGTTPAKPVYEQAITVHRPALQQLYAKTFADNRLNALVFPTTPKVAMKADTDASSFDNFLAYTRNTEPGSNAGVPGLQLPMGMGSGVKVPIGLE